MPLAAPARNRLLAALPHRDYRRLAPHLEPVALDFGQVLYEPGERMRYVYFPLDGVISLLAAVHHPAKAAEIGVVGSEGVIGAAAALGLRRSQFRAVVQAAGSAERIEAARLRAASAAHAAWYRELFRFTHTLMSQAAQTAACNRFHRVDARLARWLLATRDRVGSERFVLTQEFMSLMLGVRRPGVTAAAAKLHRRKLITYNRGSIELLNPKGLERAACECYGLIKDVCRRSYRS